MVRRRAPPKRPGSMPAGPSSRKNSDTRRLISNPGGPLFTVSDVGGFVRAVLLGVLVGGVVAFLFYPDISNLLNSWNPPTPEASTSQPTPPPPVLQKKNEAAHQSGSSSSSSSSSSGDPDRDSKAEPASTDKTTGRSAEENGSRSGAGSSRDKAKKAKAAPKRPSAKAAKREETSFSMDRCVCQREPVRQPRCGEPPAEEKPKPKPKPKSKKAKRKEVVPKEEAFVDAEEEVVEEEDSVEVELMEEEELQEPVQYIDLNGEDDDPEESPEPAGKKETPEDSASRTKLDVASEPAVLTDRQTITFTPVSPGDEDVIRVGGKPKAGKEIPGGSAVKMTSTPNQPESTTSNNTPPHQKSPSKSETSSTHSVQNKGERKVEKRKEVKAQAVSGKTKVGDTAAKKPKDSKQKNVQSLSKTQADAAEGADDPDLPEEVRNFKPTYLKAVTAKKIFQDGRRIPPIELLPQKETNSSVKVFLFNDFLSEAECDGLRRVHDKHVQGMSSQPLLCFDSISTLRKHINDVNPNVHVTPNDFVKGTKCLNTSFSSQLGTWMAGNWSYSTAFYPGESRFSNVFASRVERAMGLDPANGGKFQITSYPTGKAYKAHTDCVLAGTDPRDRVATVLVYLDDVDEGGETKFPELDIWVKPRKGRALVWNNMSPQGYCEPHSLHIASKVNTGSKYILIRWYYYKSFYSLGKRPYEPELPRRPEGTPRVSCDDYDNGSCRWYDEWNNDHLLDYEYKKYKLI